MNDPNLLTEAQAAERIGWSASNLRNRRLQDIRERAAGRESDLAPRFRRIPGGRGGERVYYTLVAVQAWLRRHPEIATKSKVIESTLSQSQVCTMLGISRPALRARRSRFRGGDKSAAPPHLLAHQEVRYRREDVVEWAKRVNWALNPLEQGAE